MPYQVLFSDIARAQLRALGARDRATLLGAVRKQLVYEPDEQTRNRKRMDPDKRMDVAPWELRLGHLRVYYAVEEAAVRVVILKIGIKNRDRVITDEGPIEP